MNQTQSIIVYRNPLEQAFWEGGLGMENIIPIVAGAIVFIAVFLFIGNLISKILRKYSYQRNRITWFLAGHYLTIPWILAALSWIVTTWYFWI